MARNYKAFEETRQQGYAAFPSSMYFADSDMMEAEDTRLHWHEAIEIIYLGEGTFDIGINMDTMHVTDERFCIVESGMLHSIQSRSRPFQESALLFLPSMLSSRNIDAAENGLIAPLITHEIALPGEITSDMPVFGQFREAYLTIADIFTGEGDMRGDQYNISSPGGQLAVKSLLMLMIAWLSRYDMLKTASYRQDAKAEDLKTVITYIRRHYAEKIYIRQLADLMGFNEQYFSRFFSRAVGKTPVEYINGVRISQAKRFLAGTDEPVLEISEKCGFGNVGHFIDVFKRYTGKRPLEYRNEIRYGGNSDSRGSV